MSDRYGPPPADAQRFAGLLQRRRERGLPTGRVEPKLSAATSGYNCSGEYTGVLLDQVGRRVWSCGHKHTRRVGDDLFGRTTPIFRSAENCARAELERRAAS